MQYANWINSTPSQHRLLSFLPQWLDHLISKRGVAGSSNYRLHYWNHAAGLCGYIFSQIAHKEHTTLGFWNLVVHDHWNLSGLTLCKELITLEKYFVSIIYSKYVNGMEIVL